MNVKFIRWMSAAATIAILTSASVARATIVNGLESPIANTFVSLDGVDSFGGWSTSLIGGDSLAAVNIYGGSFIAGSGWGTIIGMASGGGQFASTFAQGSLTFDVTIRPVGAIPPNWSSLTLPPGWETMEWPVAGPIPILVQEAVFLQGAGNAFVNIADGLQGFVFPHLDLRNDPEEAPDHDPQVHSLRQTLSIGSYADAVYHVVEYGSALSTPGGYSAFEVDPVFTFDQAAFDAYALAHDLPTFQLDQVFQIQASPELDTHGDPPPDGVFLPDAVPEPAVWALMIVGSGAIGAALRRRRLLPG